MPDWGQGTPVVLVPGIQGRWEWMRPAVAAVAARGRAITFSLAGEPGSVPPPGGEPDFDVLLAQIDDALDRAAVTRAAVCGVSFGGLVALRYAARRPARTGALVLVSTPAPAWRLQERSRRYMRHPHLLFPLFGLDAARRGWHEMRGTFPSRRRRVGSAVRHLRLVLGAPMSPARARQRADLAIRTGEETARLCGRITVPTLVVTGDPDLDRVVPPAATLEYARLIPGARTARLERTGHLGLVTRPDRFADLVVGFAAEAMAQDSPVAPRA